MNHNDTSKVHRELRGLFAMPQHEPMHRMRLAELFDSLDTALSHGGVLPEDWRGAVNPVVAEIDTSNCPGVPHRGHASTDWSCPYDRKP